MAALEQGRGVLMGKSTRDVGTRITRRSLRSALPTRLLLALALTLSPVALVSCGNPTAQTPAPIRTSAQIVATEISKIIDTVGALQTSVIQAHGQKLITDSQAASVVQITVKVLQGVREANGVARDLNRLSQANKLSLLKILRPVIDAVDSSLTTGLITITDPNILAITRGSLVSVQVALAGIEVALQGAN